MKYTFLIFLLLAKVACSQQTINKTINIEKNDSLSLSNITEDVNCFTFIPHQDYSIYGIHKVVVTDSFIFVLTSKSVTDRNPYYVLQFNKSGSFIKKLNNFDSKRNDFERIRDIQHLYLTNNFLLILENGYKIINSRNEIIIRNDFEFQSIPTYFKNELFFYKYSFLKNKPRLDILKKGINCYNVDTIFSVYSDDIEKNSPYFFRNIDFSNSNENLYVSVGYDNAINRISNNKSIRLIKFEFENCKPNHLKIHLAPKQVIIGDYCQFGYCIQGNPNRQFIYIYDFKTDKSYNLQLKGTFNKLESGIKDDVFHSGYLQLNPLNKDGYIYFIKEDILNSPQKISYTLYTAKLK